MKYIRLVLIALLALGFTSCTTIATNIGKTGLMVMSVILLALFGLVFYLIFKKRRQADKSLNQFNLSIITMLNKLDTPAKKIKALEVIAKRIMEDETYKKDTNWRDQVLAKTYLHLATQYFDLNDNKKILEYCTKILTLTPDDAMTLYNRGSIYSNEGRFEEALADLNQSIELVSSYASSYNNRGMVLSRLGRYEEALLDLEKAITMDETAITYFNRGMVYQQQGSRALALADYDKALSLCDEDDAELKEEILQTKSEL